MTVSPQLATDVVVDVPLADIEADPYPLYAWMRREQPVAWVPETERLWLTTWDLCAEAGAADEIFGPTSDVHELVYGLPNVMAVRGEEHGKARAPLDARFRPRAVREYVEPLVRPTAVSCIEEVRQRGSADLTGQVLERISCSVYGVMGRWLRGVYPQRIQRRLLELGVTVETSRAVTATRPAGVTTVCTITGQEREIDCDAAVFVTARLPEDQLHRELLDRREEWEAAGVRPVTAIGDCCCPATIAAAVCDGRRYAEDLDTPALPSEATPFRGEVTRLAPAWGHDLASDAARPSEVRS